MSWPSGTRVKIHAAGSWADGYTGEVVGYLAKHLPERPTVKLDGTRLRYLATNDDELRTTMARVPYQQARQEAKP
jgi:hypothetical protein